MTETPDTIHGRMKEGAHIAGYSLNRSIEGLRCLLEDEKFKQLSPGYKDVNEFLRDTADVFKLVQINPEERKQIAELVKELQPKASQRAIADMVGVSSKTIDRDLGYEEVATNVANIPNGQAETATNVAPPALTLERSQNTDFVEKQRREFAKEIRQQEREQEIEAIATGKAELPQGVFEVIVIDPPWDYGTKYDPFGRRAASPYREQSLEEIAQMEIPAANDCILWLWTTHKFMRHSFDLLDKWGFRDVAILTWVKDRMGLGQWLRSQTEFCIMAVKGQPLIRLKNQTTVIHGKMREHSRKPDEFYEMVNELCVGRKLDYYSREQREGWETFGNETGRF